MNPRFGGRTEQAQPDASLNYYAQSLAFTLTKLRQIFDHKGKLEETRVAAYECLAEISKIMRVLLERYALSRSKELLIDSRGLIAAVKNYNYEVYSAECHSKVLASINKLYSSFHASISNYVMEDIATSVKPAAASAPAPTRTPPPPTLAEPSIKHSPSAGQFGAVNATHHLQPPPSSTVDLPEERLLAHPDGMSLALEQAKMWSKYAKDLISYLEKRTQIDIEYHRSIVKNAQNFKSSIIEPFLPFQEIYLKFSGQEVENGNISLNNFEKLAQHFIVPLNEHRIEFDKRIKKIKETWAREKKQMNDSQNNFTKAREFYSNKSTELKKINMALKASESNPDWNNSEKIEKKKRAMEEALTREREAHENYNKCMVAVQSQRTHLVKVQRDLILKTKDLLSILEVKFKEITSHYFEALNDSMTYSPAQISKIIDDTNNYEFGKSYREYANTLPPPLNARQTNNNHFNSGKLDLDSSESDTNAPLQSSSGQQHLLADQHATSPAFINLSLDNEMTALTKEFKICADNLAGEIPNNLSEQRKQLFGKPLMNLSPNLVPEIVRQCVEEIDLNGVQINGIYRVSGVKSKVESLCHSYETNPSEVDLSNLSPNIIANVLKYFFRELPEPLMTFQLYPDFIKIAQKYASNHTVENGEDIVSSLKKVVSRLPPVHYNTLKFLMKHLRRISHNCAINNMPPSNLGIIFGPTLLRRDNEPNVTSSTLFDATHQGRVVELLILYANEIFDMSDEDEEFNLPLDDQISLDQAIEERVLEINSYAKSQSPKLQGLHSLSEGGGGYRLSKSATCSSIMPHQNQSKQTIVEARRNFFTSAFHGQPAGTFYNKYKPFLNSPSQNAPSSSHKAYTLSQVEDGLSPFSQIAASSSSPSSSGFKIKRMTQSNYNQSPEMPNKIHPKNNELSKSSSSIYSLKSNSMTLLTNNEDLV